MSTVLLNCGFCRLVIHKKTRDTVSSSRKYTGTVGIAVHTDMVWPRQGVDAIRLASTDEIALGISSHHNFRTG